MRRLRRDQSPTNREYHAYAMSNDFQFEFRQPLIWSRVWITTKQSQRNYENFQLIKERFP